MHAAVHVAVYMHLTSNIHVLHADIKGKRKAIERIMEDIQHGIEDVNDSTCLDRIHALLSRASVSLRTTSPTSHVKLYEKKDHFFPTQKNETQLRFKKTKGNPGRTIKHLPLRYK